MGWGPVLRASAAAASKLPASLLPPRGAAALQRHGALFCPARLTSAAGTAAEGWSYEQVDAETGRTPLDKLYEERLQRIRVVFESPLPPLPRDGNVSPDFLVGFAHYEYRLRDQYRAVLARALDVPVAAVQLSVAWSGRFDVTRFNRVQKVCGVCVAPEHAPPTAELQERVRRVVRAVNERQSEPLLAAHLVQASEAIAEVEFAATERDAVVAERVHQWLRERVLRPHLVLVLYGTNNIARTESRGTPPPSGELDRQRAFIEEKWLKAFSHRRVVPHVLSLEQLTQLFQEAVRRGEVKGVALMQPHDAPGGAAGRTKEKEETAKNDPAATTTAAAATEVPVKLLSLEDAAAWQRLLRGAVLRRYDNRAVFPLLFLHGECAGGAEEMRYLLHNREALDAVLLHPNDVAFKKKFMNRFRSSHSRLRMAEEMSV
ncbi:uncharacterized protein Tco025E_01614 [Trypanosoma conorhini]|uniref:Uncharacterized protein n=1 Tax=Trypanosoma conorhini TaxID=83891 RepID=A0A3R7LFA1_9TRYP|nr:uncharacterized protein Tco025E_01614 [Trypanosoma conorhini]RNF26131.1 hypothetical protein Tco025E_01614 [Trypanosoma conorhini]